jgi:uncharacterized protein (DUF433 family)
MKQVEVGKYLVIDPEVCHGQMTFKCMRVPADTVLAFLPRGYAVDQLLWSWPKLRQAAVEEAIRLPSESLRTSYSTPLQGAKVTA